MSYQPPVQDLMIYTEHLSHREKLSAQRCRDASILQINPSKGPTR